MPFSSAKKTSTHTPLSKDIKKSIAYVMSGNFLEYFDLMLMTHLAFIMTPYFMPKGNPLVEKIVTLFAFLSSFIIRPLAAVFWGRIGDSLGRVFVLSWTTLFMGISCAFIVLIPSQEKWGMYSAYSFLFARILQGISSSGESAAADIFCTELVKPPTVYRVCVGLKLVSNLAGLAALLLGLFCVSLTENGWKYCFYFGGTIALCAMNFRRKLRETKEFLDAHIDVREDALSRLKEHFLKRNFKCLIGLNIAAAAGFVFGYGFCTGLLRNVGLSDAQILFNNACIVAIEIAVIAGFGGLTYIFPPLTILRWRCLSSFVIIPLGFLILYIDTNHFTIVIAQLAVLLPIQGLDPALPVFIKGFHPKKRFTNYGLSWALSKSITYLTTGVLATFLETQLGLYGLLIFLLSSSAIFLYALWHFVPEEKMRRLLAEGKVPPFFEASPTEHGQNHGSLGPTGHNDDHETAHTQKMMSNLKGWIKDA